MLLNTCAPLQHQCQKNSLIRVRVCTQDYTDYDSGQCLSGISHAWRTAVRSTTTADNGYYVTDHYDWRVLLSSPRCRVQDGDDVICRPTVPRWNSHHTVGCWVQCYVVSTWLLWWRDQQRFCPHYQLTCTAQYSRQRSVISSYWQICLIAQVSHSVKHGTSQEPHSNRRLSKYQLSLRSS